MNTLTWNKGAPAETGLHFVAVKYGEGAGTFDFVEWDGNRWLTHNEGEVIAFATLQSLIRDLRIEWPEADNSKARKPQTPLDTDGLWEEV